MDPIEARDRPSRGSRTRHPYRDGPDVLAERVSELEGENVGLRRLAAFLIFLSMLLAGVAAWWFAVLWSMTR